MEVLRRGAPSVAGPGGALTPHLRIIANFFQPDETMTIIGMVDTVPLVHDGNKVGGRRSLRSLARCGQPFWCATA